MTKYQTGLYVLFTSPDDLYRHVVRKLWSLGAYIVILYGEEESGADVTPQKRLTDLSHRAHTNRLICSSRTYRIEHDDRRLHENDQSPFLM